MPDSWSATKKTNKNIIFKKNLLSGNFWILYRTRGLKRKIFATGVATSKAVFLQKTEKNRKNFKLCAMIKYDKKSLFKFLDWTPKV